MAGAVKLEVRLLGELAVLRDGVPAPLPASKKTRALLGYLVATQQPHLRERLCQLLWDGPDDPRAALRWSLTKLRPLVGEGHLYADRERVAWQGDGVSIDLDELRRTLAAELPSLAALRAAAERATGELLDGLDLPDCFRFQAWCTGEREAVRHLRSEVMKRLAARLDDAPEEALKWTRARLVIDPLSEAAQADVVRQLSLLGRTREAIKHYEEAKRLFAAELATRATPLIDRARDEIGAGAPLPAPERQPRVDAAPPVPSTARPLVGRLPELARLRRHVEDAVAGRAREVLFLVGEPGIGKSRLGEELVAFMRAAGGGVLAASAFEAEMVRPYGAFVDALRTLPAAAIAEPLRAGLATILPEMGVPESGGDRNRVFDAVVSLLGGLARPDHPLLFFVDDVHWLDESSAALLHYLTRALPSGHLLVAAAGRRGELADHPAVLRLLRALARDRRLAEIVVPPLDAAATLALVGDAGAGGARVFADSGGNPLYALEIARLPSGDEGADSLDGLLADRLSRFGGPARDLLCFAAALGRSFSSDLLARAAGLGAAELLAAIDELERHGVLRATTAGSYDFVHDLVRRAAYRQMSEPRRRLVHRQIAAALGAVEDADGRYAGDRAHHAALAADFAAAAAACLEAGQRCLRVFAHVEAAKISARGLSYLEQVSPETRLRLEIPLLRVAVFAEHSEKRELETAISRAVLRAEAAGKSAESQSGFHLLAMLQWRGEDLASARESTIRSAEAARSGDPPTVARALAQTSRCLAMLDREIPRAMALAFEADELARRHRLRIPEVPWALGMVHHWNGEHARAVAAHEEAVRLNHEVSDHWGTCVCLIDLAMIALEDGDYAETLRRCQELAPVADKVGGGSEGPLGVALAALAQKGLGAPDGEAAFAAALAVLKRLDAKSLIAYVCNVAAEIDLAHGDLDGAARRVEEARVAASAVERPSELAVADAIALELAVRRGQAPARDRLLAHTLSQVTSRARNKVTAALALAQKENP